MALSRKPKKESVSPDKVTELILKGGSSPDETTAEDGGEEEIIKLVQLRIPLNQLNNIDSFVKKRAGKLSRHTWIMEAIAEKIEKSE